MKSESLDIKVSYYGLIFLFLSLLLLIVTSSQAEELDGKKLEDKFVKNGNVKIHYVATGEGPLVVFIHGFPDYWYTWRHQISALMGSYRVVAMDTRGYNLSGQPESQEEYDMSLLVSDVKAIIDQEARKEAIIVGHDWGGAIAWNFAMSHPEVTKNLIIVNLPHPHGISRELANNKEQYANSEYARNFQKPDSHKFINVEELARFVGRDEKTTQKYLEAFQKSSVLGMMNYYRQNYPKPPYANVDMNLPSIKVPVLQFHGLKDTALHRNGLNGTWDWVSKDYTLVAIPDAGHWSHVDKPELVSKTMKFWLDMRNK